MTRTMARVAGPLKSSLHGVEDSAFAAGEAAVVCDSEWKHLEQLLRDGVQLVGRRVHVSDEW